MKNAAKLLSLWSDSENDKKTSVENATAKSTNPMVVGVGVAFPATRYTQAEIKKLLGIKNETVQKLLDAPHIKTRHLYLPEPPAPGEAIHEESHLDLIAKFHAGVRDIGVRAIQNAVYERIDLSQIDFLICVTSTGFAVPGVSSIISRELKLRPDLYRCDIVGMGCNGGLSGLRTAAGLASQGKVGVLLCVEINSASYVRDESTRAGIVNSLFGDGASAVVLGPYSPKGLRSGAPQRRKEDGTANPLPPETVSDPTRQHVISEILDFESLTISEQWDSMRFDWNDFFKKWSFGLSKEIPFVVGSNLKTPVMKLLARHNLNVQDVKHWSVHTGGAAVIKGVKASLNLKEADLRHTTSVLRDYGNVSSGSFLVSFERLVEENVIKHGDMGVWAAMGPGATLEACLIRYSISE